MADPFTLAAVAMVGGTILQASSSMAAGRAAKKMGDLEKQSADRAANDANAAAQRKAIESRRQANLAGSRLQALSAAGGGASDPTIVDLAEGIAGKGEYNAMTDLYNGQSDANALTEKGNLAAYEGAAKKKAAYTQAYGSILSSAGSMYGKYGGGGGAGADTSVGAIDQQGGWSSTPYSGNKVTWYN